MWEGRAELWEEKGRGKETGSGGGKREEGSTRGGKMGQGVRGWRAASRGNGEDEARTHARGGRQVRRWWISRAREIFHAATGYRLRGRRVQIRPGRRLARVGNPSGEAGWVRRRAMVGLWTKEYARLTVSLPEAFTRLFACFGGWAMNHGLRKTALRWRRKRLRQRRPQRQ